MHQLVTTDPITIMLINMTIVFAVLYGLSWIIRLIHYIDPTRKKEEAVETAPILQTPQPSAIAATSPAAVAASPLVAAPAETTMEDDLEIAAVIAAALVAYGYSNNQLVAVRHIGEHYWIKAARLEGVHTRNQMS